MNKITSDQAEDIATAAANLVNNKMFLHSVFLTDDDWVKIIDMILEIIDTDEYSNGYKNFN